MNIQERISLIMSMLTDEDTPTEDRECLDCDKLTICEELGRLIEQDLLIDLIAKRMGIDMGSVDEDINPIFGQPESDLIPKADVLWQNKDSLPKVIHLHPTKSKGGIN